MAAKKLVEQTGDEIVSIMFRVNGSGERCFMVYRNGLHEGATLDEAVSLAMSCDDLQSKRNQIAKLRAEADALEKEMK